MLFVGRARELERLREALDAALGGSGRLVLLTGEPGIGKTRLLEWVAAEAEARGAHALHGQCHDGGGAPAYWPWVIALRDLAVFRDDARQERLAAWLGSGADAIARVMPEMASGLATIGPAPEVDGEGARFRFFDAVAGLLARAAAERPLVVLLDDLHWADGSSLRLLHFVARHLARAPILLVGTLRDVEMRLDVEASVRAELARAGEHIELGGLDASEVAEVIRGILEDEPRAGLAEWIHDVTAGNPFFVDALVRVMPRSGDSTNAFTNTLVALRIPGGVRDAIRARLRPLDADTRRALTIAALLGREFTPSLVARAADLDIENILAGLRHAEGLGLVRTQGDGGRCRFVHALIAETLARELGALERARLHRRLAELLEPMVDAGVSLDEVAAHFIAAAPAGSAEEALVWASRAAERALERLGYEDAVRYYRRSLEVLDANATNDTAQRVDLLLALAEAERRVGDANAVRETFARAGALARDAGLTDALARAALGYGAGLGGVWDQGGGTTDPERIGLVESALAAIGPEPSGLRARLLAQLGASLLWSVSPERRAMIPRLGREAVAMAERDADPTIAIAVRATAHFLDWGPDDAEGRLRDAGEIVRGATKHGQHEIVLRARMYAAAHHLELGDIIAADREVECFTELAGELRQVRQLWYTHVYRGMRAYLAGRFDEVERTAAEGMVLGEVAVPIGARLAFGSQLIMVGRERGRVAETIDSTREIARAAPGMPVWACALASGLAEAGDLAAARLEIDRFSGDDFASLPRDFLWLYSLTHLCRACASIGDARSAAVLHDLLRPYEDRVAVAQHGILCDGAVARSLGLLATTLERWDDANRYFESALAQNERLGAAIFVTATQYDHARMMLRRDAAGDVRRARELLGGAAKRARELGQTALLARIEAARGDKRTPAARPPEDASARPGKEDVCEVHRAGGDWSFTHADRIFSVKDTVGLGQLLALLREPGREIHAFDLVTGDATGQRRTAGDAGEMLDESARIAYRRRLAELGEELAEAHAFNDGGRAERAQAEIDTLTDELARAVGIGGRPRRAGSDAERARLNVTRAVRRAIDAIAAHDAALGSDLERGVRTGAFCCYTPDPRLPVRWEF